MSLPFFPPELLVEIYRFLNVKDRFNLRRVSKEICNIIDYSWVHDSIFNIPNNITDEQLKFFKGVKRINLNECQNITDDGLRWLEGVEEINLCE